MSCQHDNFHANVDVTRILDGEDDGDPTHFVAEVTIRCADCDEPLGFKGMPAGMSFDRPMVSVGGDEARLPLLSPAELNLYGPLPGLREPHDRIPPAVVKSLEELSEELPRLACSKSIAEAHDIGAGMFELDVDPGAIDDPKRVGVGHPLIVVDPDGWRMYAIVRGQEGRRMRLEGKLGWHPDI